MNKHKAKFVSRGFSQKEGINYDQTFSPVDRYSSIKAIISISLAMGWKLHHMDVNITFLNGIIKEKFYIEQLEGFIVHEKYSHACKLKKELYGLKQAPCALYGRIAEYLVNLGFTKSDANRNIYYGL